MARIPFISGRSTAQAMPFVNTAPSLRRSNTGVSDTILGLGEAAKDLTGAALGEWSKVQTEEISNQKKLREAIEKEEENDRALRAAEAAMKFQQRAGQLIGEYKRKSRGDAAINDRAKLYADLEAARQKIGEESFPEVGKGKGEYLKDSARSMGSHFRDIEGYVEHEYEAQRKTVIEGTKKQALDSAGAGVPDFDVWLEKKRAAEKHIREAARSPEEAEIAVAEFERDMSGKFVDGLLASGKYADAESFIEANRAVFGDTYKANVDKVKHAKLVNQREIDNTESAARVGLAADELRRGGNAYPSESDIRALIRDVPTSQVDETERWLNKRSETERQRFRDDQKHHRTAVDGADLKGEAMPGDSRAWLEQYDPEFLQRRQRRLQAEARQARRRASGKSGQRDADRLQRQWDKDFVTSAKTYLMDDENLTPEQMVDMFIEQEEAAGRDVTVSRSALLTAGLLGSKAKAKTETAEGREQLRGEKQWRDESQRMFSKKDNGKPVKNAEEVARNVRISVELYQAAVDMNGGKPLTPAQKSELRLTALRARSEGVLNQEPAGPEYRPDVTPSATNPVPPGRDGGKKVKAWLWSPDRKSKRARYDDGSLGPIEKVQ